MFEKGICRRTLSVLASIVAAAQRASQAASKSPQARFPLPERPFDVVLTHLDLCYACLLCVMPSRASRAVLLTAVQEIRPGAVEVTWDCKLLDEVLPPLMCRPDSYENTSITQSRTRSQTNSVLRFTFVSLCCVMKKKCSRGHDQICTGGKLAACDSSATPWDSVF